MLDSKSFTVCNSSDSDNQVCVTLLQKQKSTNNIGFFFLFLFFVITFLTGIEHEAVRCSHTLMVKISKSTHKVR